MSITAVLIGIALGIVLGGLIIAFRDRQRDVFAVLLVAGIVALAVAVNIDRVQQYWQRQTTIAKAEPAPAGAQERLPGGPAKPMAYLPTPPPMMRGATGGAAPPAVENPYAGR